MERLVSDRNPTDAGKIKDLVKILNQTIKRMESLYATAAVVAKSDWENLEIIKLGKEKVQFLSQSLPQSMGEGEAFTSNIRSSVQLVPGGADPNLRVRTELPYNFKDEKIPMNDKLHAYVTEINLHPPPKFSAAPGTMEWGCWWPRWYTQVHRYPEQALSIQTKLDILLSRLEAPASIVIGVNANSIINDAEETYQDCIEILHTAYHVKSASHEKLISDLRETDLTGKTINEFREFIALVGVRVKSLVHARFDSEGAYGLGIAQIKKKLSIRMYESFITACEKDTVDISTKIGKFKAFRTYATHVLNKKELDDTENKTSDRIEFDDLVSGPPVKTNNKSNKQSNGGKPGDKPAWKKADKEVSFGISDSKVGTKPMPKRNYCPFHEKFAKHSPMDCRQAADKRKAALISHKLCFNCLGGKHSVKACFFEQGCSTCRSAHHPSICPKNAPAPQISSNQQGNNNPRPSGSNQQTQGQSNNSSGQWNNNRNNGQWNNSNNSNGQWNDQNRRGNWRGRGRGGFRGGRGSGRGGGNGQNPQNQNPPSGNNNGGQMPPRPSTPVSNNNNNSYNANQGLTVKSVHFENPSGANTSGNGGSR
jgi:hypothetical protein